MKSKVLICLLFVFLLFFLASCGGNEEVPSDVVDKIPSDIVDENHKHEYSDEWKYDEKYHWHFATCEHANEVSDKEAHDFDNGVVLKEPTDTLDGLKKYTCQTCGYEKEEKIVSTHTHTPIDGYHSDKSFHWEVCECGEKINFKKHRFENGIVVKEPTSTSDGLVIYKCSNCGYEKEEIIPRVDHEHVYHDRLEYDPEGHWIICYECGEILKKDVHHFDGGQYFEDDKGQGFVYTCHDCGYQKVEYSDVGHVCKPSSRDYFSDEYSHWHECMECGQMLDYSEHSFEIIYSDMYETRYTCSVCKYAKIETNDHIHEFSTDYMMDENYHWHYAICGCDSSVIDSYEEHKFSEWIVINEPSMWSQGIESRNCGVCYYYEERIIPALEHTEHEFSDSYMYDEEKHWQYCSYCDATREEGPHEYGEWEILWAPTETSEGREVRYCICGINEFRDVPPVEHVHTVWGYNIIEEPTLYFTGTMVGTCVNCNEEVAVIMPALNDSDYVIDAIYTPSTCQTLGSGSYRFEYEGIYYWVNGDLPYSAHSYINGKCEYCEAIQVTEGLQFILDSNSQTYWITGIGSCADSNLLIPSEYNDLSVSRITKYAFKDCTQLTSITIPDGISVLEGAFSGCYNIESVTLPTGAIYDITNRNTYPLGYIFGIEEYENSYDAWQWTLSAENYGYHFYIPTGLKTVRLTGDSTKATGTGAFDAMVSLETVYLDESFEVISNSTFQGCTNLSYINVKDTNVTIYSNQAFQSCGKLTSDLLLYEGLTTLRAWSLAGCGGLDSNLVIPESVTYIDHSVFNGLGHLESITLSSFGTSTYSHFAYLFGNQQFNEADLVPAGLKEITVRNAMAFGNYAFYDIENLEKLNLHPDSTLESGSIRSCGTTIYTNYNNAYYLATEDSPHHWLISMIDYSANEFIIAEDCKKIINNVFLSYIYESNITSLVIPDSVEEINYGALNGLGKLEELTIPFIGSRLEETIEYDTPSVFGSIFGTKSFNGSYEANGYYIPKTLKKVTVGVADYGQYAFKGMTSLEELVILSGHPDAWTTDAFSGCSNLKTLYVADLGYLGSLFGNYYYENSYKVTYSIWVSNIGQMKYIDYYIPTDLKDIYVISGDIKENAFESCYSIKNLTISGVTEIEKGAFNLCDLETVTILDSLESIPNTAFSNMTSLKEVVLCDSITSIGSSAFYNCTSLESINLPANLSYIGVSAFYGCSSLESIDTLGNVTEILELTFGECTNLVIPSLENVTYVGEGAFENCFKLEEIIMNNASYIHDSAFVGCENVTTIDITYSGETLPANMFNNKPKLTNASITAYTTYNIPANMFKNCLNLEVLELNFTISSIGDRAFAWCSSLKELYIPNTVNYIGAHILEGAKSLETLTLPFIGGDTEESAYFGYIFGALNYAEQVYYVPQSLTKVIINSDSFIPMHAFYGLTNLTYLDLSKCSSIDYKALMGCDNLEYLGISNIPVSYERSPLGYLFGADTFSLNDQYVPKTLKTLKVDNVNRIMQNLTHGLVLDELYIGSNVGGIYDAFTDGTTKCHITNVYYESTFEDWLELFIRGNNGNPAFVSDNFYFLSEEGEYYLPEVMTLSKEQIGHEIIGFDFIKELVIEPSVTRFATYFSNYQFDKVYYNGTLADYFNVSFDFDNSNPLNYTNKFYYLDETGEYKLFDGNLIIPTGVTKINKYSLYINGLTSVVLPDTLESLSADAFIDVTTLNLKEYENGYYLGTKSNPHYMFVSVVDSAVTDVIINENTKIIASYAFKDSSVTELVVPSTVETIERYAFHTDSLTKITLPLANMNDKDSNGNAYFYNMFIKQSHYGRLPENLTTVIVNKADFIPQYYFSSCSNITDITLPEDVEFATQSISYFTETKNVYKNAYYIGSLDNPYMILLRGIDNTVTSFEVHPDTTKINQGALAGFNSLIELSISNINEDEVLGKYFDDSRYNTTSNSTVPTSIKTLKVLSGKLTANTFKNMSIINLYITSDCEAVEVNGKYNFGGFASIINVYFMGTLDEWCMMEFKSETATPMRNATYIYMINGEGEYEQVTKLDISNMIEVKDYQFYGFDYVTLLIVDANKSFNPNAFGRCRGLTAIGYYDSAPYNFADNFAGMKIEQLYIFDCSDLYNVPYFAGIKHLHLPENLKYVDGSAFEYYTSNIENIYYHGSVEDWLDIRIDNYNYNPMYHADNFYVKVDEYDDGSIFVSKLTKLEVSTQLNYFQFAGLKSLEELVILEGARVDYAFYGCTNIKTITGNFENMNLKNAFIDYMGEYSGPTLDRLTINGEAIGSGSFYNVKANDVYISNTVTTIGDTAFSNATIENLYIPNSVKTINRDAFLDANISRVYYEGSVLDWCGVILKSIDANPMSATTNFYVLDENGEYTTITKVESDYIGRNQFAGSKSLEEVILLNGGIIETGALHNCPNLKHLTISLDSSLSNYYNGDVSSLESLTINGEAIGSRSLSGLTIRNLTISNSVKEIGIAAFENSKITNLYFDGTIDEWCGVNIKMYGDSYVYQNNNPMTYSDNFYVRNSDDEYERITKLIISAEAGNYQFTGLKQLEEVVVLEGGKLGDYSLYDTDVTKLTLTTEEKRIGVYFSNTPDGYIVPDFDSLTFTGEVVSTGVLGYYTINIENLVLANSIKQINTKFNGVKITNLYFDGTIDEWFNMSFAQLESSPVQYAENLYVKDINGEYYLVTEIEISETIDTINAYQFAGYKITSLEIPANVKTIKECAFQNCTNLTQVVIPNTVTYIGDNAFSGCTGLKEVVVSDNATYIGLGAFSGCSKLEKVTIPFIGTGDGIKTQFYNVFGGNSNVKEVVITNTTTIPQNAFYQNYQIEKVTLPEGLLTLEAQAFNNCSNLKEINIPDSVTAVGKYALRNCSSLTEIIIPNGAVVGELSFQNCTSVTKLELPALKMDLIKYFYYSSDGTYPTIESFLPNLTDVIIDGVTI